MKKRNSIKVLSAIMSVIMLCGLISPLEVNATSNSAYTNGLQMFFEDGSHQQLVECTDAVYMEYAEQLRNDPDASFAMSLLSFIYGEESEPTKDQYKQALLNIIKTYEEDNAEALMQQNLLDDTRELKDYFQDVVDLEMGWLGVIGAAEAMGEDASLALSVINEMSKDEGDWVKGVSALKTTLQNYEKYDMFLLLIKNNSQGNLKKAATELRTALSEIMVARLHTYKDLAVDSAEDYAKLFIDEVFSEDWLAFIDKNADIRIPDISLFKACQAAKLGAEIGKLLGNLLVGAEDVITYVIEIKAIHDISVILENELDSFKHSFQKDSTKVTESDARNYIAYGNYLISSRVRGQYCMTAIYMQCSSLRTLLGEDAAKNAESLYNRLTNNLLSIKKKLDAICSGNSLTLVLSGIEADSIQYYDCAESGNFAVIEKDGKYGIIGYDGNMILPIEYISIYQGRAHSYDYLVVFKNEDDWLRIDKDGNIMHGYPDGGDVDPDAYWYNGQLAVFMLGEGVIGGIEELSWVAIEQRHWEENAVLPIQEMTGIVENEWGMAIPKIDNTSFALLDVTTGQLVSDFVYSGFDTGNGFREGVLAVKKGDKWGFIDTKGNEITEFLYDPYKQEHSYNGIEYQYSIFTAVNGYIAVLKDGKWGLLDTQGNTVVETTYDGISQVNPDGMFWLKENGTWSLYQLGTA